MGLMSKLRGGNADSEDPSPRNEASAAQQSMECVHGTLIPRWDSLDDMGKEDRVSTYTCESCSKTLTPAEAREVKANEANHVRV